MNNPHRGRTGDLTTDALDAAAVIFMKNASPYMRLMEWEDEKQSWYLHVLSHLHTYDPERAGIFTWVKAAWRTWWIRAGEKRLERAGYERVFDSTPGAYDGAVEGASTAQKIDTLPDQEPPVHDSTPLIEELLAMVPQEKRREALFDVVALGATPSSVADRYGVSKSAVQGWVKTAKEVWREHYGIAPPPPKPRPTKTHCVNGHEFTPENTNLTPGRSRRCITCTTAYRRRHTEARRADIAAMHAA